MEQQQNSQVPPMQQESYGKRLWNLWGPIVIKWAVSFGVTMVAIGIISFMYMYSHYDVAMSALSDESVMMALYEKILKIYAKYTTWVEGAAALATIPVMLLWFHKDRVKEKMMGIVPNKKAPLWKYIPQLLMALTFCVAANNLILIGNLSSVSAGYEETMDALYTAPLGVQILSLAILIPICEELVFRGLLFKRLRMQGGFMQAAMYSAVVFGFLHMNLVQMIYGFLLGLMFAYIYEKYGSVKAPILAHVSMNLLSVLATEYRLYEWLAEDMMRLGIVTVVCATVAAAMFTFVQRIEEKPEPVLTVPDQE